MKYLDSRKIDNMFVKDYYFDIITEEDIMDETLIDIKNKFKQEIQSYLNMYEELTVKDVFNNCIKYVSDIYIEEGNIKRKNRLCLCYWGKIESYSIDTYTYNYNHIDQLLYLILCELT